MPDVSEADSGLEARLRTRPLPDVLWIELTSRCPFDCMFCTRKSLRGNGEHLDFATYERLIAELDRPRVIRLNYAGESGHYPRLAEAVALAVATGAQVELVSALASLKPERVAAMLEAGLHRLTVSLHSLDPLAFREIYRFASLEAMFERLAQVVAWRDAHPRFALDLAFVAMERNVHELGAVAALAQRMRIPVLAVHPLIARDPLPMGPSREHDARGALTDAFRAALDAALRDAAACAPDVSIQVSSHELEPPGELGASARPWPGPLPAGARIVDCDQSPFATVHVLADGRVVACEVLEKRTLGDLRRQSLREAWHSEPYRELRRAHLDGSEAACRGCVYKRACASTPPRAIVSRENVPGHQLVRGWHADDGGSLWSQGEAALLLGPRLGARRLRVRGRVASGGAGGELVLRWRGDVVHRRRDPEGTLELELELPRTEDGTAGLLELERTQARSPHALGRGADTRELGFALYEAALL